MKKQLSLLLAVAMIAALVLPGCDKTGGGSQTDKGTVNVYNWGEYINTEVLEQFTEQTGITVNYKIFNSNESLYSVLQTGGSSYDVIIPSDYMISRLISEDKLEKIDFANVPNYKLIGDTYKDLEYDPNNEYSVPYMWGTVGIIYNSTIVTEEVDSWGILFDEKYAGQILQFDNSRDAVSTALMYLGYPINTTDEAQIKEAYDLLAEQKPLLQKYVMDQIYDLLEGGEAAIGPYYAGDFLTMQDNNPDLKFVLPKEGSNLFVDAMCIPKGAQNKANAEAFINFMCSTDVCVANMSEIGYASPNSEAAEQFAGEFDLTLPEDEYRYNILFPSQDVLSRCDVFINLPEATLKLYADLWTTLKS